MAALQVTDRARLTERKKRIAHQCTSIISGVTRFMLLRGLTSIEDMIGHGFIAHAIATIIVTGMSIGVHLLLTYLHERWPRLKTLGAKLWVAAAAIVGLSIMILRRDTPELRP